MQFRAVLMFAIPVAALVQTQQPVDPPTFRVGVEVFQIRVQIRADKGHTLPALTNADFIIRVGSRAPAALHSEKAPPSDDEIRRFRWPKEEEAAIYVLTVEARDSDCKTVPKVTLNAKTLKVRGVSWTPKVNCAPPGAKITR